MNKKELIIIDRENCNENIARAFEYFRPLFENLNGEAFPGMSSDDTVTNFWIAGGCLRDFFQHGFVKSDVDIFTSNEQDAEKLEHIIGDMSEDGEATFKSNNVSKFNGVSCLKSIDLGSGDSKNQIYPQVDVVKRYFDGPSATIGEFDFTVTQFAMDVDHFVCTQEALFDLISRKLTVNKLIMPVATMRRIPKYIKKGFTPCQGTMVELAKGCVNLKPEELKEVSQFYFD